MVSDPRDAGMTFIVVWFRVEIPVFYRPAGIHKTAMSSSRTGSDCSDQGLAMIWVVFRVAERLETVVITVMIDGLIRFPPFSTRSDVRIEALLNVPRIWKNYVWGVCASRKWELLLSDLKAFKPHRERLYLVQRNFYETFCSIIRLEEGDKRLRTTAECYYLSWVSTCHIYIYIHI